MTDSDTFPTLVHPDDLHTMIRKWNESLESGAPFEMEGRFRRRDGAFRWFLVRSTPARDEDGKIVKWFGASTDIHQQKDVEEELRQANSDLEQFAYSASHDLQEPLRSVRIYSELLAKRYRHKLDGQALEFCDYLCEGASRMETLVRDLLEYTQVTKLEITRRRSRR